ncbi:MAG: multicopper oxidase domain-containing protein [Bacteroidota bacterium]|jgi:bilirubin oxidase
MKKNNSNKAKKTRLLLLVSLLFCGNSFSQTYNNLWIPDTLSGTQFNLNLKDTFMQMVPGNQTITGGINGKFWGPTLFFQKGDTVHMNVHNQLNDATTIHWHGFHLPAVMDGGPHQIIPPGTVWQPYWKVTNNAATYWYHPHLHEMTQEQITKGLGGLIIVRDSIESSLALPRKYGIDDIPLVLSDRDINSSNQFSIVPYGDSLIVNGTLRAQYTIPAQIVRFRILNAAIERSFNIGFSDNRNFSIICSDGGLLNAPVSVNRYILHAGERIEILVNFGSQNGTSVNLKAFNSSLGNFIAGGENFPNGPFANYLGHSDFNILHLNVATPTTNPITSIPSSLTTNNLIDISTSNTTRYLTISDSAGVTNPPILGPNAFIINHRLFDINYVDYEVPINNTEIWQITSSSIFGHPFHIHDVEFNIISVNGVAPVAAQAGWKDVVFIPGRTGGNNSVVKFIAKFDDYADSQHPFMYHCHISLHEDEGMMGQFVVTNNLSTQTSKLEDDKINLFPNPANGRLFLNFSDPSTQIYYVKIYNMLGKVVYMLPKPKLNNGIDISELSNGIYSIEITEEKTKNIFVKKFIKQ